MLRKIIGFGLGLFAVAALIERQWLVGVFLFLLAWVLVRQSRATGASNQDDTTWSDTRSDHAYHRDRQDTDEARRDRDECGSARDDDRDVADGGDDACDIGGDADADSGGGGDD